MQIKNSMCDNWKTQIFGKLQKLKMWQLKKSKRDKTQIRKNLKTQIMTKRKTQTVTKLKTQMVTKLKNSYPDNSISDKTLKSLLVTTTWPLDNRWYFLWENFCYSKKIFRFKISIFFLLQNIENKSLINGQTNNKKEIRIYLVKIAIFAFNKWVLLRKPERDNVLYCCELVCVGGGGGGRGIKKI